MFEIRARRRRFGGVTDYIIAIGGVLFWGWIIYRVVRKYLNATPEQRKRFWDDYGGGGGDGGG